MASARLDLCSVDNNINETIDGAGVYDIFETHIATSMRHQISTQVMEGMHSTCYVLKRRLVLIAWRVYQSTLALDGDRLTVVAKARRYMELVCFLFDSTMLSDALSLRLTCKSNNERRRFPVYLPAAYHELEVNLIEEWVAHGASRFVSTGIIDAVMAIHCCSYTQI